MCRFENELLKAHELYAVAGWYGSVGLSFFHGTDCEKYRRYYDALRAVSGIEVSNPDLERPNENGIIFVTYQAKTAVAAAIGKLITDSFSH